ncbi:MAG TPA: leucyl aminopeptidase [Bdellovibrionota bacterium]|nr:leucyl aminopeptidase [Bdellovibrionota bacterium]
MSIPKLSFSVSVESASASKLNSEVVVLPVFRGGALPWRENEVGKELSRLIQKRIDRDRFDAEAGKCHWIDLEGFGASRVLLIGLGERKDYDRSALRNAYGTAAKEILERKVQHVGLPFVSGKDIGPDFDVALEGFLLGTYRFDKYRKNNHKPLLQKISAGAPDKRAKVLAEKTLAMVIPTVRAIFFSRDLVNEPANVVNPSFMETQAKQIAKEQGVSLKVFGEAELKKRGMNLILAVGMGSQEKPRLLHFEYKPKGKSKKKVAFCGKGVTFDSGGLSLKSQDHMYGMKADMAGAAAVLAIVWLAAELKIPVHLHGLAPLVENLPGAHSVKPGDVFVAHNGKSVEIENTDAEGRLILADTVSFASTLKVDHIIDAATLTGACMVALGEDVAGMFTFDSKLAKGIGQASERVGERFWRLPMEKAYMRLLKSDVADLRNVGGKYAGAITAALFLSEFVSAGSWAHLDIAGPAFLEHDSPICPKGGTGFGVRTMREFLST